MCVAKLMMQAVHLSGVNRGRDTPPDREWDRERQQNTTGKVSKIISIEHQTADEAGLIWRTWIC